MEETPVKLMSIDIETNGLLGKPFIICAIVRDGDRYTYHDETFLGRCPIDNPVDEFVRDNVLPACLDIPENYSSLDDLLSAFTVFYKNHNKLRVISHIPFPVETNFFSLLQSKKLIGEFEGPYPLIDVGSMMLARHEDPTSLDKFMEKHKIEFPEGQDHDPFYDATCALRVYEFIYSL